MRDYLGPAVIVIIMVWCMLIMLQAIYNAVSQIEQHVASWTPPAIPQCEAPTWDRIREGCEHEGD